jgi:predicted TIM-barrel fold metal-dependent hydrolase
VTNVADSEKQADGLGKKIWANSGDSHFIEPENALRDRLVDRLPKEMLDRLPHSEKTGDGYENVHVDGQVIRRRLPAPIKDGEHAGMSPLELPEGAMGHPAGERDAVARLVDMDHEGVWGQVMFPSLGFWNDMIKDCRLSNVIAQATNDWAMETIQTHSPRFACAALLPLRSVDDAIAEVHRAASVGYYAVFIPSAPPHGEEQYNHKSWEPLWDAIEETGLVLTVHIGTGGDFEDNHRFHGQGGAVLNYVETSYTGQRVATQLVSSGVLDRHPRLKVLISEAGSSWVPTLGDRMEEAYRQHSMYTRPKLSRPPKEILYEQVYTSFQHDKTGPIALTAMGYRNGMWGDDYPHIEGTFGHSQQTLHELFDDLSPDDRYRITLGAFLDLFPQVGLPAAAK